MELISSKRKQDFFFFVDNRLTANSYLPILSREPALSSSVISAKCYNTNSDRFLLLPFCFSENVYVATGRAEKEKGILTPESVQVLAK